jgi:hypothetical protein
MTGRKRWPNHAENARVEALACARKGVNLLTPLLEKETDPDTLRRVAIANHSLHRIITELLEVGPQAEKKEAPGVGETQRAKEKRNLR